MSDSYRKTEPGMSLLTKCYNLPFYMVRKLFLLFIKAMAWLSAKLAYGFGFYFSVELEDKPEWKWFRSVEVPSVRVEVDRD